jgi:uncharacterized glyoxalase superfamily protein PhnB
MLVCRDGNAEINFCKSAFGAVELSRRPASDATIVHATLGIGAALIMIHGETPHLASRAPNADASSPVVIYLYVEDADETFNRAIAAGASAILPMADAFWGDRVGRVMDPAGHVWNIAARIVK